MLKLILEGGRPEGREERQRFPGQEDFIIASCLAKLEHTCKCEGMAKEKSNMIGQIMKGFSIK